MPVPFSFLALPFFGLDGILIFVISLIEVSLWNFTIDESKK